MHKMMPQTDAQIEAEIAAAYAEVAAGPTERPETWDQLTEEEIREMVDDDRR